MDPVTSTTPQARPAPTQSSEKQPSVDLGAGTNISSDFDTFLRMLTVQVQNQDPLNPVDATDYATQLATFSGVEQQVLTNDLLTGLQDLLGGGSLQQMGGFMPFVTSLPPWNPSASSRHRFSPRNWQPALMLSSWTSRWAMGHSCPLRKHRGNWPEASRKLPPGPEHPPAPCSPT